MAVPSPSRDKSELRALGLARRCDFARGLTPDLRAALEAELAARVLPHLQAGRIIAAYHPLRDEISPRTITDALRRDQRHALPWFSARDARMIWREGPAAEPSPWGVLQPPAAADALAPDIVLVPVVLVDRRGTRIGHGKGHYDRALAHLREAGPVRAIGIAWDSQISEEPIPADPWDIRLDAVATPKEWILCA